MEEIKRVGILGCGTMGAGIAQVVAMAGYLTWRGSPRRTFWPREWLGSRKAWKRQWRRASSTPAAKDKALSRLTGTVSLEEMKDCQLIIEALPEDLDLKKEHFQELDVLCPPSTILASNTSSLTITELAASTRRPGQVIGLHFFNPAPVMELVEIVRTPLTSGATLGATRSFVRSLGKTSILAKDRSGLRRKSSPRSLSPGRDPIAGGWSRLDGGNRPSDAFGMRSSDGSFGPL